MRILAPMTYKDKEDVKGEDHYRIRGFKLIPVFDLSQTAGSEEQLPILVTGLRDTVEGEDTLYRQVLRIIDIPVMEVEDLIAKGSYRIDPPEIQVRANLSVVQKIKTLCHEYGHHLHHVRCYAEESYDVGEVIAESAAFIVCCHLGLDTSEYSIPYLASWNQDLKAFQTVTRKIQQIASEMVTRIEDQASEAEFES